jgi:hypothetical protein
LFEEHVQFVREHPKHAEWVKIRVPAEAWARLHDPSEVFRYETGEENEEEDHPISGNSPDGL